MSIDYKQLESMVREALGGDVGGGVMGPSAPEGVPHRMPAADVDTPEQDRGDEDANKMYEIALVAREATEKLVEALDEPIYDGAYEHAFKASACLRKALNDLEAAGAHPMPDQRVVAPSKSQQPYGTGGSNAMNAYSMGYADFGGGVGLEEQDDTLKGFGTSVVSKSAQAKAELEKSKQIASGDALEDVDTRERAMLLQIEKILTDVAEKDDLSKYRPVIQQMLKRLIASSSKRAAADASKVKQ